MGGETIVCASLARGIEARLLELLEDVDDGERVYATPAASTTPRALGLPCRLQSFRALSSSC
jgi:hypothetical protein